MKHKCINAITAITALLLAPGSLRAQTTPTDPLADHLFAPDLVMHFQTEIGLGDAQREALKEDMERAHPRFQELQQQLQKETENLGQLLKSERVDDKAALAQFDKIQSLERDIKRTHLALVIGLKNRLTADQQAKLRNLKTKYVAEPPPQTLAAKAEKVQAGVERWQNEGRDPSAIGEIMQEIEPLMQERKFKEAEAVLDRALKVLDERGR